MQRRRAGLVSRLNQRQLPRVLVAERLLLMRPYRQQRGKFFAEARYSRIFMGNRFSGDTEYQPVTFGFRW